MLTLGTAVIFSVQIGGEAALTPECEDAMARAVFAGVGGCLKDCATAAECNSVPVYADATPPPPPPPSIGGNDVCMPALVGCRLRAPSDEDTCNAVVGCLWNGEICAGAPEEHCNALPGCEWELTETALGECTWPPPPPPPPPEAPPANFTACEETKGCVRREATEAVAAGCVQVEEGDSLWQSECYSCSPECQALVDDA